MNLSPLNNDHHNRRATKQSTKPRREKKEEKSNRWEVHAHGETFVHIRKAHSIEVFRRVGGRLHYEFSYPDNDTPPRINYRVRPNQWD